MSTYDLYGVRDLPLVDVRARAECALGVSFEEHDSLFHGGIYYRCRVTEEESLMLKNNLDPFDDEPVEQAFAEHAVLLYVNGTNRSDEIRSLLGAEFHLLRHEVHDQADIMGDR